MDQEKVIVIDFGGQYNQLVARRVRECNVYCEIYSYKTDLAQIKAMNPKGIILTGGPNSCYEDGAPTCTKELFELGVPVLGLCYGAQLMQHVLGGKVEKAPVREYGKTETFVDKSSALFSDVSEKTIVWMSHFDYISQVAPGFKIVAHTADCPVAAAECTEKNLYAIQFHPEVLHTQEGTKMLHNFVRGICGCAGTWKMDAFVENTIKEIREKIGNGKVLLALSGGVDSSVAAGLLSRAIGKQLTCVFVDHGLLRKDEGDEVESVFGPNGQFDLNFIRVNAQERYYSKLAGVTEPEAKRKIIGEEFIRVFEEEAKKIGAVDFLAQGTIYPDVVESGLGGESAVIKSHHNVGGLPDFVDFKEIIEPLRNLFKDEVRKAGLELGIPDYLVYRQPFPGPGLGIRIIGDITPFTFTFPLVGFITPLTTFNSVDFPAPLLPIRPTTSPFPMLKETSLSAQKSSFFFFFFFLVNRFTNACFIEKSFSISRLNFIETFSILIISYLLYIIDKFILFFLKYIRTYC